MLGGENVTATPPPLLPPPEIRSKRQISRVCQGSGGHKAPSMSSDVEREVTKLSKLEKTQVLCSFPVSLTLPFSTFLLFSSSFILVLLSTPCSFHLSLYAPLSSPLLEFLLHELFRFLFTLGAFILWIMTTSGYLGDWLMYCNNQPINQRKTKHRELYWVPQMNGSPRLTQRLPKTLRGDGSPRCNLGCIPCAVTWCMHRAEHASSHSTPPPL